MTPDILIFTIGVLITAVAALAAYSVGQIDVPYDSTTSNAPASKGRSRSEPQTAPPERSAS